MLRLEAEVQNALRCVADAAPARTQPNHRQTYGLPFKFLLTRLNTAHGMVSSPTVSLVLSSLLRNFESLTKQEKQDSCDVIDDSEQASVEAARLRMREPFCSVGACELNADLARAVFAGLACNYDDHKSLMAFAKRFVHFWCAATGSSSCNLEVLFPAGMPPLECHLLPSRVSCCSKVYDPKVFIFRLRSVIDASVSTLGAFLMPCDACPIPTESYFAHLRLVYIACGRMAALHGVAASDANAFTIASLCSAVASDSFASLVESCKHSLALDQPRGAYSFVWVAACACFYHAGEHAANGSLAVAVVARLEASVGSSAVEVCLSRLACLAVSSRSRHAFDLIVSTDATKRAACSETTCLDILSHSPSGLLGIFTENGLAVALLRSIASSACARGELDDHVFERRLHSVRRFVSIDDALIVDDALKEMIIVCNEWLEIALWARNGPISFLDDKALVKEHAKRARAFRKRTIAAVCDAFRCRVAAQTAPPRLVAWLSSDAAPSHPTNALMLFARGFASCDGVDEFTACFEFEDELRGALHGATFFSGKHGSIARSNLKFTHLDQRTTDVLTTQEKHAVVCSRVQHTPLNAYSLVSVVCL